MVLGLIWRLSDPTWTQICGAKNRLFDRFVPRIRSSAELMAMSSRPPDQDNPQERLKTAQEECQRLREENARLRPMLGINHSPTTDPLSTRSLPPTLRPPRPHAL